VRASGKKYAKGSQKTYGGWEPAPCVCWKCGRRLTLARDTASHHFNPAGESFSLCGEHGSSYREAFVAHVVFTA
jgi:hypothetical protein